MKQKLTTYNLKLWLPIVTVGLSLLVAFFQVFSSYQQSLEDITTTGRENADTVVFQLSHFINYALANDAEPEARSIVASAALIDNVEFVVVVNPDGQIEYASHLAWVGQDVRKVLPASYLEIINQALSTQQKLTRSSEAHILSASNLSITTSRQTRDNKLLFVDYSIQSQVERAFHNALKNVIPLIGATLLMLLALLLMMKRLVTQPLHYLHSLLSRIKTHQSDIENPLQGESELAEIGQALSEAGIKIREDISQLSDRENRLSITLNAIGDGVIVTDEKGFITRINPTAAQMTGWSQNEALNQPIQEIFLAFTQNMSEQVNPVQQVLDHHSVVELHNHTLLKSKNGKTFHIFQTAAPVLENNQNLVGVVLVFQDVSKEYLLRSKLRESVDFLENLLRISPSVTFVLKPEKSNPEHFYISYISQSAARYTKVDPEECLDDATAWKNYIHPEDLADVVATFRQAVAKPGTVSACEYRLRSNDDSYLSFETYFVATQEKAAVIQVVGVAIDISQQKQVQQENQLLGNILERSLNEIYIFNDENLKFIQVNFGAQQNLGYNMNELRDMTPLDLKKEMTQEQFDALIQPLRTGRLTKQAFETNHYRKDGSFYPASIALQLEHYQGRSVFIAMVSDISERKQSESRINFLAYHDMLTSLPNRVLLDDRLNQALSHSDRKHEQFAVLYLDLDRFKIINDTLGHATGDELLVEVAARLKSQVREGDTVSRTGGDEFTIILLDTDSKGAAHVAQKLLHLISQPYQIGPHTLYVTVSIGISMYPDNGDNAQSLKQKADNAMYRAKETERNYYQFFTNEMHDQMLHRMHLESQLHLAIEREELSLVYQPQLNIENNTIVGAEALIRWTHSQYGVISPAEFIPIAEDSGLINQIGSWVLREALSQASRWRQHLNEVFVVAINISGMQFRNDNLVDEINALLSQYNLSSADIELEITESIAMADLNHTIKQMQRLADAGIQLSLDDFGTGFSSLNSLKKFPIHKLKIDKSFIDDMLTDKDDEAIVEAIITLAQTLGLITVAEGVETQEQFNALRDKGCETIQGYLFSKPVSANELMQCIRSHQHKV